MYNTFVITNLFSEIKNREHLFIASESHKFGVGMDLVGIWDCGEVCDLVKILLFFRNTCPFIFLFLMFRVLVSIYHTSASLSDRKIDNPFDGNNVRR